MPEQFDPDKSPWIDHWTNDKRRERYEFHARENYQLNRALQVAARQGHMEYGKWLIASVLAIHGGSLYSISSLRTDFKGQPGAVYLLNAACWNVSGIVLIIFTAFLAWLNFQFAEQIHFKRANPAKVYKTDEEDPVGRFLRGSIYGTLWGAALLGIASIGFFILSVINVFWALSS